MNRKITLSTLALCSLIAIAACKPKEPEAPVAPTEPTAPAAPAEPTAPLDTAHAAAPAEVPFDIKGFAGVFTGTLPCADCAGIDTKISLNRDGTYKIHESYQGKSGKGNDGDGTWTAEENGKRIRLDPNSKSEQDHLFAISSQDQLDSLDAAGKPIDTQAPHSLKRTGPAMQ